MKKDYYDEEMKIRFVLSDILRNIINKSENGEIALVDFMKELEFTFNKGRELEAKLVKPEIW